MNLKTMPLFPRRMTPEEAAVDLRMEQWRKTVCTIHPMASGDYIRTLSEEIVRRAVILSQHWPIRALDVAVFFLERTEAWVMGGLALNQIGHKLPKNLREIGIMMMAEGSPHMAGLPLTKEDLADIKKQIATTRH